MHNRKETSVLLEHTILQTGLTREKKEKKKH